MHVLVGVVGGCGEPADEHGREPVLGEVRRRLGDDASRELVRVEARVSVLPPSLGRDDVRRVTGDQVELLAGDRLEQAAESRLDVVDPVQRRADLRERERALVDIGGDDAVCVRRGEERVHTVARADVESAPHLPTRGDRREPVRGGREARDPPVRIVHSGGERVEGEVDPFGRDDPGARQECAAVLRCKAEPQKLLGCPKRRACDGTIEQEQANRIAELVVRQPARKDQRVTAIGRDAVLAEQLLDRLGGVADGPQRTRRVRRRRRGRAADPRSCRWRILHDASVDVSGHRPATPALRGRADRERNRVNACGRRTTCGGRYGRPTLRRRASGTTAATSAGSLPPARSSACRRQPTRRASSAAH